PDTGRWSLTGPSFTMTIGGETIAAGTLENGVLTITLMEMNCVFVREGVTPPKAPAQAAQMPPEKTDDQAAATLPPGMALFTCYGDLYQVTYPTALFYPPGDGLTDLVSDVTGTRAWITRLDSQQAVETWLSSPPEEHQTVLPLVVAGYPAQALVYAQEDTWHSQVIVNFGQDLGTRLHPMFAACLTFSGPDREAVWGEAIQQMVHSLTLL
ncbi:MAG: hypothetical protein IJE03_08735, partial [Ruminiclostridium sp.]|nr:hypothetical protein [Ruminiclostridium sp.]